MLRGGSEAARPLFGSRRSCSPIDPEQLGRRDPTAPTELGHLPEAFDVGELLKQAAWLDDVAGVWHSLSRDGDEIDLVVERDDGLFVSVEVKAAARVSSDDIKPPRKLCSLAGDSFPAGIAFCTGTRPARAPVHPNAAFMPW